MNSSTKLTAKDFVFCTHMSGIGTWSSAASLVCDLVAGVALFGRVAVKDQQLLDSPGFLELWSSGHEAAEWRRLYQSLLTAKHRVDSVEYPRVAMLLRSGTESTGQRQIYETLDDWLPTDPFIALHYQTAKRALKGKVAFNRVLTASGGERGRVLTFANELAKGGKAELKCMLNDMETKWERVFPQSIPFSFGKSRTLGERFEKLANGVDWDQVNSDRTHHDWPKLAKRRREDLIAEVSSQERTAVMFRTIGHSLDRKPRTPPPIPDLSYYLRDLLTWNYITNYADARGMRMQHSGFNWSRLPTQGSTVPPERVLKDLVAPQYSQWAKPPSKAMPHKTEMIEATIGLLHDDPQILPYVPEYAAVDAASIERVRTFHDALQGKLVTEKIIRRAVQIEESWPNVQNALGILAGLLLLTKPQSLNDAASTIATILSLTGNVGSFFRPWSGLAISQAFTFTEERSFSTKIAECFPTIWKALYAKC